MDAVHSMTGPDSLAHQAGETRLKQLPDRPVLRVLQHVLEELDGRDGEGEVVPLAVLGRLDKVPAHSSCTGSGPGEEAPFTARRSLVDGACSQPQP